MTTEQEEQASPKSICSRTSAKFSLVLLRILIIVTSDRKDSLPLALLRQADGPWSVHVLLGLNEGLLKGAVALLLPLLPQHLLRLHILHHRAAHPEAHLKSKNSVKSIMIYKNHKHALSNVTPYFWDQNILSCLFKRSKKKTGFLPFLVTYLVLDIQLHGQWPSHNLYTIAIMITHTFGMKIFCITFIYLWNQFMALPNIK